jgi:toxin ParE1/3/4
MRYVVASRAAQDLRAIASYLVQELNEDLALDFATRFARTADRLAAFPQLGRVSELGRFRFHGIFGSPYLIVYRWQATPIEILRVVHGARDLPALLRDL